MIDYVLLLTGIILAGAGGEIFVRGSVGLARALRVPPGIVGATVAAFATSSPELTVATNAALAGTPQIGLGDALGSNVVNVALVLGIALCISAIAATREGLMRDFPVALAAPVITGILLYDGSLSRADALILLTVFLVWLSVTVRAAISHRQMSQSDGRTSCRLPLLQSVGGLAVLLLAGRLIVAGASAIATDLGIEAYIIGATIVAVGTSAPELATTVVAKFRGHDDLSLGTILGSNIFNGLAIVSITGLIAPVGVEWGTVATTLLIGVAALTIIFPGPSGMLGRARGTALILLYLIHVVLAFAQG